MLRELKRSFSFLEPKARRRWFALVPVAFGAAMLEAVGAALVFAWKDADQGELMGQSD